MIKNPCKCKRYKHNKQHTITQHNTPSQIMCVEIIPGLWLGDRDDSAHFTGSSVVSIGCNPYGNYDNKLKVQMRDSTNSHIENHLEPAMHFIHTALRTGNPVLVHCKSGVNRSPAFVIAYLMLFEDYSVEDAIALVQQKRPVAKIHPHYLAGIERYRSNAVSTLDISLSSSASSASSASSETSSSASSTVIDICYCCI